jgi:hypothetical protein
MRKSDDEQRITFRENVIHVGVGFAAKERPPVREALSSLASHLGRWDPCDVDVEVTLQDRGGKEQRVTLRTMLPGLPQLIAYMVPKVHRFRIRLADARTPRR